MEQIFLKKVLMPTWLFVVFPWAILLACVLLQLILMPFLSGRGKGWLAFTATVMALGGVVVLWPTILNNQPIEVQLSNWDGPASLSYYIDGLSFLFALMAVAIGAAVLLFSIEYMVDDPAATRFYALMLIFIAGFVHLVFCADLLLLYFSWEVIGLCSFLLVGFWYRQKEAASGARKVLVMTHIAGYGLLAAILLILVRTGLTLWTDPRVVAAFSSGMLLLFLVAAMAKSVQFPLHTWIPDAMAAPTPVSALLHAACYVTAGVYLIARLYSFGALPVAFGTLVTWVGTITLVIGGLFAMLQSDLKRLLAFSTISQIGYMVMGLGLGTPLGIAAGLLHCLNHGLFKGGLFLCAGSVQHAIGTRDMDQLGGVARRLPTTAALWLIMAGSIAGLPLLSGFVSKWLLYNAALQAGQILPALISWVVSVITIFYFLKATTGVFFGEETPVVSRCHPVSKTMQWGAGILAGGSVLLGVAPQLAVYYLINPLLAGLGMSPVIGVSWLGLTITSTSWYTTAGLILALVAIGVGVLIYLLLAGRPYTAVAGQASLVGSAGIFTGGEPLAATARLPASDFSLILKHGLEPFYRWFDPDRYYLWLWHLGLSIGKVVGKASRSLERRAIPATLLVTAVLFISIILLPVSKFPASGIEGVQGWMLPIAICLSSVCLICTASALPGGRLSLFLMAISGILAIGGLSFPSAITRIWLLESAAVFSLLLVWMTSRRGRAAQVYLLAVILSGLATISSTLLLESAQPSLLLALLLVGIAIKLALIPVYFWLPLVAESVPAPVAGLVIAVVDIAAFGELLVVRGTAPWLFNPLAPWLCIAVLSALGGAVLMLGQGNLKRLLIFSSLEDMGYLLFAVSIGSELALQGALYGAAVHSLGKALLFSSLAKVEADGGLKPKARLLAVSYPVSGVGFLVGALALTGIPPTLGYIARWRIYTIAAQVSPWLLGTLLLASAVALLAYARALAVNWWSGGEPGRGFNLDQVAHSPEPVLLRIALLTVGILLLVTGIWPAIIGG